MKFAKQLNTTMKFNLYFCSIFIVGLLLVSCNSAQNEVDNTPTVEKEMISKPNVPDWAASATIYEVNTRQFTPEGTFNSFKKHVSRIKKLGADIIWFMPIHPISETKRKGTLGSYYAVSDYKGVNPEHGSMEDFKSLVEYIHSQKMYVIIDWVPNHTGWDNNWIKENPDYYTKDKDGNITDPIDPATGESWGWTDVADLNFDNQAMRNSMIEAMKFWIEEVNIDGFRCDVAHNVPADFWKQATDSLYAIRPIFMLAEAAVPEIVNDGSFAMDYGWEFHHLMNEIAKGHKNAMSIDTYLIADQAKYEKGYHMHFTSNHDENTWSGTVFDRMGDAHLTLAVLSSTFDGMPLLYSGQESGNKKRLEFFEKDSIDWGTYEYAEFYSTLFNLKHRNKALWNGKDGGELVKISTSNDENIYAFSREKDGDVVIVVLNLSAEPQEVTLLGSDYIGEYNNLFAKGTTTLTEDMIMNLNAWDYIVLSNK